MTVNLTLNEITASEALRVLDLIKQEVGNVSAPTVNPTTVPLTAPVVPVQQPNIPCYTIEQLQTAIAPLLDAGKVGQIQTLVQSFGVSTLMEIPKERYGEFANGLRNLGGVL